MASEALGRRTGAVGIFHGGKSVGFSPPDHSPWAKKSPSGVAPEGLKSLERLEPSRRAGGGDDGYNHGGQAKGGFARCCSVKVHSSLEEKPVAASSVESVFKTRSARS